MYYMYYMLYVLCYNLSFNGGERICESALLIYCYEVDCNVYVVKNVFNIKCERVFESKWKTKLDEISSEGNYK